MGIDVYEKYQNISAKESDSTNECNDIPYEKFKKMGFKEVYGQSSNGNVGSAKVIENNGGILLDEKDGTRYYKIELK